MSVQASVSRVSGADLHVHSTHSDGVCSPGEVVRSAHAVGLRAVAITDHDTVSALAVARPEAERLGIELINGVELTAECDGREFHILGHFLRDDAPDLVEATSRLRDARQRRIEAMTERLLAVGLHIDLAAIARAFPRATIGRKHLAEWLVRTRQAVSTRDAFARYLGDGGPGHVPKPRLPWSRAIEVVREAGGIAGLAHPPYDLTLRTLQELAAAGLGSLEVDGPGIPTRRVPRLREWANRLGLVPIAGSDFHAPDRPGRWIGSVVTPGADLERLRERAVAPLT